MRILINFFIAAMVLLGSLAAPCIAAPVDHGHAAQVAVGLPTTADGHHRGDARSLSGSHCQQDGIVAQAPDGHYREPEVVWFGVAAAVAFAGTIEPVEQRPPISSV